MCSSGGSVLSGTSGPSWWVWLGPNHKCMSRNDSAPVFPFGLGYIRPVDADLVPLALLTTRTTVKGPPFCMLSTACLGILFPVMEAASYNHFNPDATISSIGLVACTAIV